MLILIRNRSSARLALNNNPTQSTAKSTVQSMFNVSVRLNLRAASPEGITDLCIKTGVLAPHGMHDRCDWLDIKRSVEVYRTLVVQTVRPALGRVYKTFRYHRRSKSFYVIASTSGLPEGVKGRISAPMIKFSIKVLLTTNASWWTPASRFTCVRRSAPCDRGRTGRTCT